MPARRQKRPENGGSNDAASVEAIRPPAAVRGFVAFDAV